ncbi:hypothetical protein OWR29_26560 [Actinoplanes sp. Pm04-4]|uniref:Uncharacterized protein n=1 Tax=Paractinoplanes pyxinae TaxID=2997416 RepID=A0ABT4B501_9ACTN|nr:hypothetical protein [Actinoplanes pyxinae]MCY1141576.1 hypothetical protein [Actinoplanes pyxinae]
MTKRDRKVRTLREKIICAAVAGSFSGVLRAMASAILRYLTNPD